MSQFTTTALRAKGVPELRQMARSRDISGAGSMAKTELVIAIADYESGVVNIGGANLQASPTSIAASRVGSGDGKITVSSGASSGRYPVVGKSVQEARNLLREILNIDSAAQGLVNGESSSTTQVLKEGDILEFIRKAGVKGQSREQSYNR